MTGHYVGTDISLTLIRKILVSVCVVCMTGFLLAGLASAIFPFDLGQCEGNLFEPAFRLMSGRPTFGRQVVLSEPYMYAAYGPAYYALLGGVLRLTGMAFWPGRSLSLLATAATALLIYRIVKGTQKETLAGFVAATVFIITPATWPFGFLQRVDAVGVFFTSLCIALGLSSNRTYRNWLLAGCAGGVAFLIKPTLVASSLAVAICLIAARAFRELSVFLAGAAVVLIAGIVVLILTDNSGYLFNQAANAQTPFAATIVLSIAREILQNQVVVISIAIVAIWLTRTRLRPSRVTTLLPPIYLLVSGALALAECGKVGASVNYFYEFFVALALCAGLAFVHIAKEEKPAFLLTSILFILSLSVELASQFRPITVPTLALLSERGRHERVIGNIAKFVPAEEPVASYYPDLVIRSGRRLFFNDLAMYLMGPEYAQSLLSSSLKEKKLAAYISAGYTTIPSYSLVEEKADGYSQLPVWTTNPGPLLYLRDDLWEKYAQAAKP